MLEFIVGEGQCRSRSAADRASFVPQTTTDVRISDTDVSFDAAAKLSLFSTAPPAIQQMWPALNNSKLRCAALCIATSRNHPLWPVKYHKGPNVKRSPSLFLHLCTSTAMCDVACTPQCKACMSRVKGSITEYMHEVADWPRCSFHHHCIQNQHSHLGQHCMSWPCMIVQRSQFHIRRSLSSRAGMPGLR